MMHFYTILNKHAKIEADGFHGTIKSRDGSPACGWDLKSAISDYADGIKITNGITEIDRYIFKYYNCVATIDCETLGEAFHLTNSEEAFANNYYGKVNPLTATGALPSMSIGDIVLANDEFFMCMGEGWELLEELTAERAERLKEANSLRAELLEDYEHEKYIKKHYNKGGE